MKEVKKLVKFKLEFALVIKYIFDSKKAQRTTKSFMSKNDARLKGVHVEVVGEQALEVISVVRKVIKLEKFKIF